MIETNHNQQLVHNTGFSLSAGNRLKNRLLRILSRLLFDDITVKQKAVYMNKKVTVCEKNNEDSFIVNIFTYHNKILYFHSTDNDNALFFTRPQLFKEWIALSTG